MPPRLTHVVPMRLGGPTEAGSKGLSPALRHLLWHELACRVAACLSPQYFRMKLRSPYGSARAGGPGHVRMTAPGVEGTRVR